MWCCQTVNPLTYILLSTWGYMTCYSSWGIIRLWQKGIFPCICENVATFCTILLQYCGSVWSARVKGESSPARWLARELQLMGFWSTRYFEDLFQPFVKHSLQMKLNILPGCGSYEKILSGICTGPYAPYFLPQLLHIHLSSVSHELCSKSTASFSQNLEAWYSRKDEYNIPGMDFPVSVKCAVYTNPMRGCSPRNFTALWMSPL